MYLLPVWKLYHAPDTTGVLCLSLTGALFVWYLLMEAGVPLESYSLFSCLSLETEWGKGSACPDRLGPSNEPQRFAGSRKGDYGQEEKSKFRGGNVCVASSKGWGLGESNQKWRVGVTQRRLGRDRLGRTHVR